jgi:hypothetical protein
VDVHTPDKVIMVRIGQVDESRLDVLHLKAYMDSTYPGSVRTLPESLWRMNDNKWKDSLLIISCMLFRTAKFI